MSGKTGGFKHHSQEFKDEAIMYWNINQELPKKERMTQKECVEWIGNVMGQTVSIRTVLGWINKRHYAEGKKGVIRGAYGFYGQDILKGKEKDAVETFVDELLVDEDALKKEIIELKKRNLKLIQAVDILNKTVKSIKDEKNGFCPNCESCLVCASDNCDCYE